MATQLAFGADLASHPRHLRRETAQLIHHGVDCLLQLENLAPHVGRDLFREVAIGHRCRHIGNVSDLRRQIACHQVHAFRQILPDPAHVPHLRLPPELAVRAHLTGDARDLGGEAAQLIDHGVDRVFELENLAPHVHGDFLGEVAVRHGHGHIGNVPHLIRQVARHGIHAVGQVLPGAGYPRHNRLSTQLAVRAHFTSDPRDLGREAAQLIDHGVDRVFELKDLAAHIRRNLFREIAVGDGDRHFGNIPHLVGEVAGHRVDIVGQVLPGACHARHDGLATQLAFGAHLTGHSRDLGGERIELADHAVHGFGRTEKFTSKRMAFRFQRHGLSQIAFGHCPDDAGHFRRRTNKVIDEAVDRLDVCFPLAPRFRYRGPLR